MIWHGAWLLYSDKYVLLLLLFITLYYIGYNIIEELNASNIYRIICEEISPSVLTVKKLKFGFLFF